eukprot:Em0086g11a
MISQHLWDDLKHFLDVVDPRTLLTTERQLREAVRLLRDFEEGRTGPEITSQQLWEAQKINRYIFCGQAIIHPDTDKKIFMPFGCQDLYHSGQ